MSLEFKPESYEEMKERYPLAVKDLIDTNLVKEGFIDPPSRDRKHVFDYPDGLRLIVSLDLAEGRKFLHVSASGNDKYIKSVKDEGFDGLMEDVMLRLLALRGKETSDQVKGFMSAGGALHLMFKEE